MLREDVFKKVSDTFGTTVGIANIMGVKNLAEEAVDKEYTPQTFKKVSDEIDINNIICNSIEIGKYRELQNNLYALNRVRHNRIKDITIYKKAWKEISNK